MIQAGEEATRYRMLDTIWTMRKGCFKPITKKKKKKMCPHLAKVQQEEEEGDSGEPVQQPAHEEAGHHVRHRQGGDGGAQVVDVGLGNAQPEQVLPQGGKHHGWRPKQRRLQIHHLIQSCHVLFPFSPYSTPFRNMKNMMTPKLLLLLDLKSIVRLVLATAKQSSKKSYLKK